MAWPRITFPRLLVGGVIVLLVLAAARFLALRGLFAPVRVVTGSMAERLVGEHFVLRCADCDFAFRFGVDSLPPNERAVCPNCGFARNPVDQAERRRGQRVLIDRAAYTFDPPRRFDVVAFPDPQRPTRFLLKRVVGLPGEQIGIRQGDLVVDGQRLRKSLAEFRRMSVVVHDHAFQPQYSPGLRPRWRPELDQTQWILEGTDFTFDPAANRSAETNDVRSSSPGDWLVYHHWRCFSSPYPRTAEAPVSDNLGYNQGESRELRVVRDLVLHCRLDSEGPGQLVLGVHDGFGWKELTLDPQARRGRITSGNETLAQVELPLDGDEQHLEIDFGVVDQQVVLGINEEEMARQQYSVVEDEWEPIAQPLRIGSQSLRARVLALVVRRDIHYLDPTNLGQKWDLPARLAPDRYFVLGDNPSLSLDGRHGLLDGVTRDSLLGRVIPLPR